MKRKILYSDLQKYVKGKDKAVQYYLDSFLNKTLAMFEYSNMPEGVNILAMERTLQTTGVIGWTKHEGVLYALNGTTGGEMDAYNQPTRFLISNPYLKLNKEYTIGEDLVLMKNDFLAMGLIPILGRYAVLLTDADISLNTIATMVRVTMLLSAPDDKTKASADVFVEKILDGDFSVIGDGAFFDGVKMQTPPTSGNNSITQLIELIQYYKASFYNEIGLNANYNMKRERLTVGELQVNVDALLPFADNMLYQRKEAINNINEMFGTDIAVDFSSAWKIIHEESENLRLNADNKTDLHQPTDDTHGTNGGDDTNVSDDKDRDVNGANDGTNDKDLEINKKNDKMKKTRFNYFQNGDAITKEQFEKNVPKDWQNELNEYGEYSYGLFKAIEVDVKNE